MKMLPPRYNRDLKKRKTLCYGWQLRKVQHPPSNENVVKVTEAMPKAPTAPVSLLRMRM